MPVTPLAQQCRTIIIMGVAGSGKSTIASLLSDTLGYVYLEGDDFHSPEAKAMMAAGIPLTDALRESWIDRLCQQLALCAGQKAWCLRALAAFGLFYMLALAPSALAATSQPYSKISAPGANESRMVSKSAACVSRS